MKIYFIILCTIIGTISLYSQNKSVVPEEWIDSYTGHKIIRLTRSGTDNESFYFHNNPFLKNKNDDGYTMVYYGKIDNTKQLFSINLKTLETQQLTNIPGRISGEILAQKQRAVIYQMGDSILSTNVDSRETKLIKSLPKGIGAKIYSVNADESLIAGKYSEENKVQKILQEYPEKHDYFTKIYEAGIKHSLFVLNIKTGELKVIHEENDWTNHIQFSPVDPDLLMYCHEGPWHKVDRIWTINVQTGKFQLMHKRTMEMEIAGHEFFSPDGKTIWFDLQQPRSVNFFLGGVDIATGMEKKYALTKDEWSVHYTISPDQKLFSGDGGDSTSVAKSKDGKWIYLLHPAGDKFTSEKLVSMANHKYKLEPNVHFTPDGKWIIFRSNMYGETHIFAVEILITVK